MKKTTTIIIVLVVLVLGYLLWQNNKSANENVVPESQVEGVAGQDTTTEIDANLNSIDTDLNLDMELQTLDQDINNL